MKHNEENQFIELIYVNKKCRPSMTRRKSEREKKLKEELRFYNSFENQC